ncbi:MAG: DUF805 domain-containing protein [Streptococcus sp.]|nr:DUF805 domain-containing protein [Streptococcus sp.]
MFAAYKKYWTHYADFSGRSSRSDYWWVFLINVILGSIFVIIGASALIASIGNSYPYEEPALAMLSTGGPIFIIALLFLLANLIPDYALTVRRLRDAGFHWAFIFLKLGPAIASMIPGIAPLASLISLPCFIVLIVLLCQKTKWIENAAFINGQQPTQGQQFNQPSQDFGQQPTQGQQINQLVQEEPAQQSIQPTQEQQDTSIQEE